MDMKIAPPDLTTVAHQGLQKGAKQGTVSASDAKTKATAHKVATEFEAMFAGMMLKSMRSSMAPDKLTGGGRGEEVFQSLLDQEYAMAIANQGGLGIAQSIEKQLLEDAARQEKAAQRRNPGDTPR